MLKRKVKLKITATSRQTIRLPGAALRVRCSICEREVEMLTSAEAASFLEIDGQTFDQLVAGGRVHALQTVSGSIRICKDSLLHCQYLPQQLS